MKAFRLLVGRCTATVTIIETLVGRSILATLDVTWTSRRSLESFVEEAKKPCEGGGEKNCTGKEKWCLVDENGGVHEKCRDLDCSSSRFSDWFQCEGDTTLACHKSPTDDICVCSCVKKFCDRNEGQKCSGKTKWCFNETAGFTEMCGESGCDASKSKWKVCKSPGTKMSCEKTSGGDVCHCNCGERIDIASRWKISHRWKTHRRDSKGDGLRPSFLAASPRLVGVRSRHKERSRCAWSSRRCVWSGGSRRVAVSDSGCSGMSSRSSGTTAASSMDAGGEGEEAEDTGAPSRTTGEDSVTGGGEDTATSSESPWSSVRGYAASATGEAADEPREAGASPCAGDERSRVVRGQVMPGI
ncbi:hypothetical protein MRX96_048505 [Rhipicephalus microplus]